MRGSVAIALTGTLAGTLAGTLLAPGGLAEASPRKLPKHWSPEEVAELRRQAQIVKRSGGVTAHFFVSAPPEKAYAILTDHPRLPEFMPNLDRCTVRKHGSDWAEVEMINAKGTMVLRREFEPPRRISWRLVESPVLRRVDGSWSLDPVEGGSVLTYDSEVETRVPVPGFVIQFVQQDSLHALIANVRQRVDSGGRWTKPDFKQGSPP